MKCTLFIPDWGEITEMMYENRSEYLQVILFPVRENGSVEWLIMKGVNNYLGNGVG